ncbi:DUF6266 family protein [Pedobacter metabolipauper]|uniref:Uncharacterized protein n=1 Tax=Pedobacter metabolipauper TaxID=425513 RepID=A0A4R6SRV7_9SPHI|nr:DUF6266 family protein [Pedobacter metabolipauper]TDQ07130.1 hypothetical protein ATK78_4146 [Pedobacter metabolipauper]
MARIKNGILGGVQGCVGDVEGFIRNGEAFIRKKKKKSTVPRSRKQLANMQKMSVVGEMIHSMTTFVALGFGLVSKNQSFSANNAVKSYQLKHSLQGEYPHLAIDYAQVRLSEGQLPIAVNASVNLADNGIEFSWEVDADQSYDRATPRVMLLVYAPALKKSYYTLSGARKNAGTNFMELPDTFMGHKLHAYMSFITDDKNEISNSVYVGSVGYEEEPVALTTAFIVPEKPIQHAELSKKTSESGKQTNREISTDTTIEAALDIKKKKAIQTDPKDKPGQRIKTVMKKIKNRS